MRSPAEVGIPIPLIAPPAGKPEFRPFAHDQWMGVMPRNRREVVQLTGGLTLAIVFDTVQQLAWNVESALREPLLGLVAILMVLRLINWLKVLELADLSYAQPITSLSYVTVAATSALFLQETLSTLQIVGMAVIMVGVWCISQTEHKTSPSEVSTP